MLASLSTLVGFTAAEGLGIPSQSCALPHCTHSTPPWSCMRPPTAALRCPTEKTPWGHSRDSSPSPSDPLCATAGLREEKEQTRMMPYRTPARGLQQEGGMDGWCWWASVLVFFLKHQPGMRWFEKESYRIKFLALPNLSLPPSLYIWQHALNDPTTETLTDKAWGVTLYKQVTEDKQWPSEASGAAQSRHSSLGFRQLQNCCPCQLAQAKSSLECVNCADQHWERAVNEISENSRPCCLFTSCTLHFYSGDDIFSKNVCKWSKALHAWLTALAPVPADMDLSQKTVAGLRPAGIMKPFSPATTKSILS